MNDDKKKLIIIGTGPQGQIAKDFFLKYTDYRVLGFACHEHLRKEDTAYDLPLIAIERLLDIYPPSKTELFVAIGYRKMNKIRQSVYEQLKGEGYAFANFIHPSASVSESAVIGENVFVFEDNTIQPYVEIGNNTVLWSGNHIGHHSKVGNHSFITSHVVISGFCEIGNNVFIGVNTTFHDSLTIGDECLIGAGSLITKNTKPKTVYINSPTKPFPKDSEQIGF
jgi:sugar O-acyltransferase (sialic acid O-acetyltransferase NeuD family)